MPAPPSLPPLPPPDRGPPPPLARALQGPEQAGPSPSEPEPEPVRGWANPYAGEEYAPERLVEAGFRIWDSLQAVLFLFTFAAKLRRWERPAFTAIALALMFLCFSKPWTFPIVFFFLVFFRLAVLYADKQFYVSSIGTVQWKERKKARAELKKQLVESLEREEKKAPEEILDRRRTSVGQHLTQMTQIITDRGTASYEVQAARRTQLRKLQNALLYAALLLESFFGLFDWSDADLTLVVCGALVVSFLFSLAYHFTTVAALYAVVVVGWNASPIIACRRFFGRVLSFLRRLRHRRLLVAAMAAHDLTAVSLPTPSAPEAAA